MCNDFGNHIPYSDYLAAFSQTCIPVTWPDAIANLQSRDDIWPTDRAPVSRVHWVRPEMVVEVCFVEMTPDAAARQLFG